MNRSKTGLASVLLGMGLGVSAAWAAGASIPEPLPEETVRVEKLAPADGNRIYVTDPAFGHMVDSRVLVLDGNSGRFLGLIGTGFGAVTTLSRDGKSIYVATTYYPRLSRGRRDDVFEIHDTQTLELKAEIDIPPRRAQGLSYRGMLTSSADGRFVYIQNATPATSVTVVDLESRKAVAEVQTPGCWSIYPWRTAQRFSTLCGDGTMLTVGFDAAGQPTTRSRSAKFFDPDSDPIFTHPEVDGDQIYFVSYNGNVYGVRLAGDAPAFDAAWSLLDGRDKKNNWRPGGLQISALHRASGTFFVNMHDKGAEGSHKNPSKEIWAFDLASRKRLARIPSNHAVSITASQGGSGQLFLLNIEKASIEVHHIAAGYPKVREINGVGETAMFMEVN